jgi:hypothetical protein
MDMRLDGVEIKTTVAGERIPEAVQALGLPPGGPPWQIYFCEDVTAGLSVATPLLDAGVILRARSKPGGKDDTTVKLRPCRRSQLTDRWLAAKKGDDWELKVEADWAGGRRSLATSLTADRPGGVVSGVGRGDRAVEDLFVAGQLDFLRDCGPIAVNLRALSVLPPVTATRWGTVAAAPAILKLRAERWTVGSLDFLELSTVAPLEDAPARQDLLIGFVGSLGVGPLPDQENKTRQVLRDLVERVLGEP